MRLLLLLALTAACSGQVLQLTGGASTLMGGTGAGVTAFLPGSTINASGGIENGHSVFGLSDSFNWQGFRATVGSQQFGGSIDGAGVGLQSVGIALKKQSDSQSLGVFLGSAGVGYSLPYFSGNTPQHLGAAFFFQRKLGRFRLGTLSALNGGMKTNIESLAYTSATLQATAAGGVLLNSRYATGQLMYSPVKYLHLGANQQDSFGVQAGTSLHVVSDGAGVSAGTRLLSGQAYFVRGTANGIPVNGRSLGVNSNLGPVLLSANYFKSGPSVFKSYTATEKLTQHFRVSETAFQSRSSSVNLGGGFTCNRFSVDLQRSIAFVPFNGRGFEQVTAVNVSFRVRDAVLTLANYLAPTGMRWTAYGNTFAHGPLAVQGGGHQFHETGKLIITGVVRNRRDGAIVEGAAVRIGKQLVFSNASGVVFARTKKGIAVTVQLSPEDFATAGRWRVVDSPASALPAPEGHEQPFTILVEAY